MSTTTPAAELADAMRDAPELCAQCGKPLTDDDAPYLCDACTERASCAGSDIGEPWAVRYDPYYQPDRYGISVLGVLALACLIAALIGTAGLERVRAQDTTLTAPHAINGRIYEWPDIGTDTYTRSCEIVDFYEDGSATAWCSEDGAIYTYLCHRGSRTRTLPGIRSWRPVGTMPAPHARRQTWSAARRASTLMHSIRTMPCGEIGESARSLHLAPEQIHSSLTLRRGDTKKPTGALK